MDERARRTILRARKSVHANIKFVEPCNSVSEIRVLFSDILIVPKQIGALYTPKVQED